MAEPVRVGIVGANPGRGWALTAHLPALTNLPGFEVTAVATTRQESADETAKAYGVPHAYGDATELLTQPDVDVVSVCVKVPHHYEYVRAAIEAGKHVYSEWPLGANSAQAAELAALASARGVHHIVGLQGRKSPLVNTVRDLVAEGYLGDVLSATLSIAGAGRGANQVPEERVWAMDRNNGATTLSITGGHNIDVFRYCLGEPRELDAVVAVRNPNATVQETGAPLTVTSPDVILVHGILNSGAYCAINVQAGLPKGSGALLEIQGSDGAITVSGSGSLHLNDDVLQLRGSKGDGPLEPIEVRSQHRVVPDTVPAGAARNIAGLYLALKAAIEGASGLDPSFDTALSLHHLLDAIAQASETGRRQILAA